MHSIPRILKGLKFGLFLMVLGLFAIPAVAQVREAPVREARARVDTIQTGEIDTTSGFRMTKSPLMALGLSAVLPGAGQIYVGQWWKAPVVWALGGTFVYAAQVQNNRYLTAIDSANRASDRGDRSRANQFSRIREIYRDDRDKWYIYAGLTYVAAMLDSYISAHLFDFDVTDTGPLPTSSMMEQPLRLHYRMRF